MGLPIISDIIAGLVLGDFLGQVWENRTVQGLGPAMYSAGNYQGANLARKHLSLAPSFQPSSLKTTKL